MRASLPRLLRWPADPSDEPADPSDEPADRPSLLAPGLVVFALGVVLAVQSAPMMALALVDQSPSLEFATASGVVTVASAAPVNLAVNVAVAFLPWLALAAVTYVGAQMAGGSGTFRQTLAAVARCAVPWIAVYGAVLLVATAIGWTSDATIAAALGGHSLGYVPGHPPPYFDGRGLPDLRTLLFLAGVAWTARIWARAVPAVHGPDLARGASVVGTAVVALAVLGGLF